MIAALLAPMAMQAGQGLLSNIMSGQSPRTAGTNVLSSMLGNMVPGASSIFKTGLPAQKPVMFRPVQRQAVSSRSMIPAAQSRGISVEAKGKDGVMIAAGIGVAILAVVLMSKKKG